jgi:hypothetical protein
MTASCSPTEVYRRFIVACWRHHQGDEDEGRKNPWNVGKLLPDYTAQHPRRHPSSNVVSFSELPPNGLYLNAWPSHGMTIWSVQSRNTWSCKELWRSVEDCNAPTTYIKRLSNISALIKPLWEFKTCHQSCRCPRTLCSRYGSQPVHRLRHVKPRPTRLR